MASDVAVSVPEGGAGVGVGLGGEGSVRPVRHLRALPPAPRSYAVSPGAAQRATERWGRRGLGVPARPAVSPGADLPPLRLTARGRRLVIALTLLLAVGLVALGGALFGGDGDELELMGTASVIVEPGDTLWSIARGAAGERDVREVVHDIQVLNDLDGAAIHPGQVLTVP